MCEDVSGSSFSSLLPDLCLAFLLPASDIPVALDLADVVSEAVHHPLGIDLALAPSR